MLCLVHISYFISVFVNECIQIFKLRKKVALEISSYTFYEEIGALNWDIILMMTVSC